MLPIVGEEDATRRLLLSGSVLRWGYFNRRLLLSGSVWGYFFPLSVQVANVASPSERRAQQGYRHCQRYDQGGG